MLQSFALQTRHAPTSLPSVPTVTSSKQISHWEVLSYLWSTHCLISGQAFSVCSSPCPATCADPTPACPPSLLCIARCECQPRTVFNEACVPKEQCGVRIISTQRPLCLLNRPCQFTQCSSHPGAWCVVNNCSGCTASFFDSKGNDITNSCSE